MSCGTITIGSNPDCDNLPVAGTKTRALVMNYDDVSGYTEDIDGNITGITLTPGSYAHEFIGYRNDVKSSQDVVRPDTGITQFMHHFGMTIYDRTQVQKNNVQNLSRGLFVVIVENRGNDEGSFEVLGLDVGLEMNAGPIRNSHENGGFFILTFSTQEDGA